MHTILVQTLLIIVLSAVNSSGQARKLSPPLPGRVGLLRPLGGVLVIEEGNQGMWNDSLSQITSHFVLDEFKNLAESSSRRIESVWLDEASQRKADGILMGIHRQLVVRSPQGLSKAPFVDERKMQSARVPDFILDVMDSDSLDYAIGIYNEGYTR
ncbi:MAG: hypothetical protein H7Y12_15790, partial [Sphingobacteriaceae bacterium]|nr:hypothetical protein [Cytophagaceae bacterium]